MARPVFDFRAIRQQVKDLATRIYNIPVSSDATGSGLTNKDKADIGTMLNAILNQINLLIPTITQANKDHEIPSFFRKNLDYGERKNAEIRSDDERKCPFNLNVPRACNLAGQAIYRMTPIENVPEDKKEKYKKANKIVFIHCKEGKQCPYADKILDKFNKVDCDFGDNGQGEKSPNIIGSPLYSSTFNTVGLNGLYNYPLGWMGDNTAARNLFFGMFSYLGKEHHIFKKISKRIK